MLFQIDAFAWQARFLGRHRWQAHYQFFTEFGFRHGTTLDLELLGQVAHIHNTEREQDSETLDQASEFAQESRECAVKGGPAEQAGVRQTDILVGLSGIWIETIRDFKDALGGLKVSEEIKPVVLRGASGWRSTWCLSPGTNCVGP